MKDLNQFVVRKGLLILTKASFCLAKGHLGNPEVQLENESLPNCKLF